MLYGLWYDAHKYEKNKINFDIIVICIKYRLSHVIKDNLEKFQEFMASEYFERHSQFRSQYRNKET